MKNKTRPPTRTSRSDLLPVPQSIAEYSYLCDRYGIYLVKCSDLDASANTAIHAYLAVY